MSKISYIPIAQNKCPFGERALDKGEECYYGNSIDKCHYFKRYYWCDEHTGTIECSHPPQLVRIESMSS